MTLDTFINVYRDAAGCLLRANGYGCLLFAHSQLQPGGQTLRMVLDVQGNWLRNEPVPVGDTEKINQ